MRSKKKRKPALTRIEKLTKGLMLSSEEVRSKFTVREAEEKGRALFLFSRIIKKDSFVLEYEGDIITHDEAETREKIYAINDEGCYILFFRFQGKRLAIDATRRFDSYARYLNHSKDPNIRFHPPLLVDLTGQSTPRIAGYALRDIHEGEEIVFDYGITDRNISWLRNRKHLHASELSDSSDTEPYSSDDESSNQDLVTAVTRTPTKCHNQNIPSYSPKCMNFNLKPSKYLAPNKVISNQNPLQTPLTVPPHGYCIRHIAYPSIKGKKKCFIASLEGLGQPLKIMLSMEVTKSLERKSTHPPNQISISSDAEESSIVSSPNFLTQPSHLPKSDLTPCSVSKVLQWQENSNTASADQQDSIAEIKILNVTSLLAGCGNSSSSVFSTATSESFTSSSNNPSVCSSVFPSIDQATSGNSISEHFALNCHSNSNTESTEIPSSKQSIFYDPPTPHKNISSFNCPRTKYNDSSQAGSPPQANENSQLLPKNEVKSATVKSNLNNVSLICLSDSEEESDVVFLASESNMSKFANKPFLCARRNESEREVPCSSSFCENTHHTPEKGNYPTQRHRHINNAAFSIDPVSCLKKSVLPPHPNKRPHPDCNQLPYYQQMIRSPHHPHSRPVRPKVIPSHSLPHSEYDQRKEPFTLGTNDTNTHRSPRLYGRMQPGFMNISDRNSNPVTKDEFDRNKNETGMSNIKISNVYSCNIRHGPWTNREQQPENSGSPRSNRNEQSQCTVPCDVVEILDEEQSDVEIVSDEENSRKLNSHNVNRSLSTEYQTAVHNLSKSPPLDSPLKPHIAIVKPYSQQDDRNAEEASTELENLSNGINQNKVSEENQPSTSMKSENDVIELVEEYSFERNDVADARNSKETEDKNDKLDGVNDDEFELVEEAGEIKVVRIEPSSVDSRRNMGNEGQNKLEGKKITSVQTSSRFKEENKNCDNIDEIVISDGQSSEDDSADLTHDEKIKIKEIFQPLVLSSDNLTSKNVMKAISENYKFFSVLLNRGVSVNQIRKLVWKQYKLSLKI